MHFPHHHLQHPLLLLHLVLLLLATLTHTSPLPAPAPTPLDITLPNPLTSLDNLLQKHISASLQCHLRGTCAAVLAAHIKCKALPGSASISECSCHALKAAGRETKECMRCQAEAGEVGLGGMVEEFDRVCRQFGVVYAEISRAGRGGVGGNGREGVRMGVVAAGAAVVLGGLVL